MGLSSTATARASTLLGGLALMLGLVTSPTGCSLGNIPFEECTTSSECSAAFGLGSVCQEGFCSAGAGCTTGHDCRALAGGGACVAEKCVSTLPSDPLGACTLTVPEDLTKRSLSGANAPLLIGGIFRQGDTSDRRRLSAARLAVQEIAAVGGLTEGRPLSMIVCDNAGPDAALSGQDRQERMESVLDYLAGTLGVPFIVGPVTSSDSLGAINYLLRKRYPTVLMSPAATSPALTDEPDRLSIDQEAGLFWRTAPSDQLQGRVLAEKVVNTHPLPDAGIDKIAVVFLSDAYGEGLAGVFQAAWGNERSALFPFRSGDDFSELVGRVGAYAPDGVMIAAIAASDSLAIMDAISLDASLDTATVFLTDGSKDAEVLLGAGLRPALADLIFKRTVGTAPAAPRGSSYDLFVANYKAQFNEDPTGFSFTAHAYDAVYVGAAALVHATASRNPFDGIKVAQGLTRLSAGATVVLGKTGWSAVKNGLTFDEAQINVVGVSGPLDFDPITGEAPAAVEIWKPSNLGADCGGAAPCFRTLAVEAPGS